MQPEKEFIEELVRRILEAVHPLRIILFGSAAKGQMTSDSDIDVLVVMPDGTHRRRTAQAIDRRMWGFEFPTDVLVVTQSDLSRYRDDPYTVIKSALDHGKDIYRVAG